MAKSIVIVESPAKARTIGKYLGKGYAVRASAGHIRDLPSKALGVDIKNGFKPSYRVIHGKEKVVKELQKEAAKAEVIYLAADPDREGEAICFHLAHLLDTGKDQTIRRVLFNEITKEAVLKAFETPIEIDQDKVDAQQARRILDRLVGYKISPLLWKKVRVGLSAGRVQTVAVRLIVDREREVRAFNSEEYWDFKALFSAGMPPAFQAKASKLDGKKFSIDNQEDAEKLYAELQDSKFSVLKINKKARKRKPVPSFITSKLQQDAARKLGYTVKKTMSLAQRLYEGVDIGEDGSVGLITYMRTDSTRVSDSALQEARDYITDKFGEKYLPGKPRIYKSKKNAQDAHEAIRPTSAWRDPEGMKPYLSRDEFRLYSLIWKRSIASQMKEALFDQTQIAVEAGRVEFNATGSIMRFDGFLKVYSETSEGNGENSDDTGVVLPDVSMGDELKAEELTKEQKFTQPPPRFNEASLVKALEEKGIGRPSTYQQILQVIMSRDYVRKDSARFVPTELGELINDLLIGHFGELFDYDYTAKLERDLDSIEEGSADWIKTLESFYEGFRESLQKATVEMKDLRKNGEATDEICTDCGKPMIIKWGRFGKFMSCSDFPKCRNTRPLIGEEDSGSPGTPQETDEVCDKCGAKMVVKEGRYGSFLACSAYPTCKNTKPISVPVGVRCPKCGKGDVVEKRTRKGRMFYGCDQYPACDFVSWQKPVPEICPNCASPYLLEKTTRKEGTVHFCPNKECGYKA
jgi:DNA topoisomerase I